MPSHFTFNDCNKMYLRGCSRLKRTEKESESVYEKRRERDYDREKGEERHKGNAVAKCHKALLPHKGVKMT